MLNAVGDPTGAAAASQGVLPVRPAGRRAEGDAGAAGVCAAQGHGDAAVTGRGARRHQKVPGERRAGQLHQAVGRHADRR